MESPLSFDPRAKRRAYEREWKARNPDRVRAAAQRHRAKRSDTQRRWERNNPEKRRDYHLKRRFGLEPGSYDKMFAAQRGRCEICGRRPTRRWFDVDHCHRTGRIRGLLCNPCNRQLGFIEKYFEEPQAFDRWMGR